MTGRRAACVSADAVVEEAVSARPRGPLAAAVQAHHGYRQRGVAPARHLGLPSPWLTLIVTLDEPLRIAEHVDGRRAPADYRAVVGGLHTRPAVVEHDGAQSGVQLRLSPLASRALLGVPAGALAAQDLEAGDVLGPVADELHERLRAADSWQERFDVLDGVLGAALRPCAGPAAEVRQAWRLLRHSRGTARIGDVAREVGWSERHLTRQFQNEFGLGPKAAARVMRFDRARHLVAACARHAGDTHAAVAARCGFADQSHLSREFVAFTGLGPQAWLAAEVGNLHATGPDGAADSTA